MSSSSDNCCSSGGEDNLDYDSDNGQSTIYPQPYVVLDQYEISQRQEKEITWISTTLSLPTSSATLLLSHYIGFNIHPRDTMSAAICGPCYCAACWSSYIGASIIEGPGCLTLRCPHSSRSAAVDQYMVYKLVSSNNRSKYSCYLLQSYVETRKPLTRFYPSSDCELVVEAGNAVHYDVKCRCSRQFCLACMEDAHRPLNCRVVAKWVEEGEKDWLPANSKRSPKCMNIMLPPILPLALPLGYCSDMPMRWDNFGTPSLGIQPMPHFGYNRDKPASITEAGDEGMQSLVLTF